MGGGPSDAQKNAANAQAALDTQLGGAFSRAEQFKEEQQAKVNPFYTQRMEQGLPYYANMTDAASGNTARAFMPARQQLAQQMRNYRFLDSPNGFATGARTDLDAAQARAFDMQLQGAQGAQEQARQAGAAGLLGQAQIANPLGYAQAASQGNAAIMNAPLASPGLGGLLGGLGGGLLSAIPF